MTDDQEEFDRYEQRGYGFEIHHDLNRGTQLLDEEDQEIVENARHALWDTLGIITCVKPPDELTDEDWGKLRNWLQHALYFRNVIRSRFDDIEVPSEGGTVH
jgi:hypothetical protein